MHACCCTEYLQQLPLQLCFYSFVFRAILNRSFCRFNFVLLIMVFSFLERAATRRRPVATDPLRQIAGGSNVTFSELRRDMEHPIMSDPTSSQRFSTVLLSRRRRKCIGWHSVSPRFVVFFFPALPLARGLVVLICFSFRHCFCEPLSFLNSDYFCCTFLSVATPGPRRISAHISVREKLLTGEKKEFLPFYT